jgi:hypothetical protein
MAKESVPPRRSASQRIEGGPAADLSTVLESDVFVPGAPVLMTLSAPREKFWGAIITISQAGVSVRGIGLESFEDFLRQVRDGDNVTASAVFFPMHRIERMELDERNGEVPSMFERFKVKCGHDASEFLAGVSRK